MKDKVDKFDYIIIGAGIMGLAIARTLISNNKDARILVLEKEAKIGLHSSGRNSGVLHSGIYYPSGSIKAIVCANGARKMISYCKQHELFVQRIGKVIVPFDDGQDELLQVLQKRADANGAKVELINSAQLKEIEPEAYSVTGNALYSPGTCVVDPLQILLTLQKQLEASGVIFRFQTDISKSSIDAESSRITVADGILQYAMLYNAAGLFADKIAKLFNAAKDYRMMPFKGSYYKLSAKSSLVFNGLIYPVPDLNMPFLGVHSVKSIAGDVYFGPSALPILGRENYSGLSGFNMIESTQTVDNLIRLFIKNNNNFRNYLFNEAEKITKQGFCKAIQKIIPAINSDCLQTSSKVGIRAQLLNTRTYKLEMDFIVERCNNTVHVLNAVSPAFTSAFEFSERVVNDYR